MALGGFSFQPGGGMGMADDEARRKRVGGYGAAPQGAPSKVTLRNFTVPASASKLSPLAGGGQGPDFLQRLLGAMGSGQGAPPPPPVITPGAGSLGGPQGPPAHMGGMPGAPPMGGSAPLPLDALLKGLGGGMGFKG